MVFIDDLDRCLPDQILALLEALKLYLNRTDCVFFLAVDSQRLVQAVAGKYKDVGIDGADYLEKIVQMPFQMPRLSPAAFSDYLDMLLPDDLKAAAQVLSTGLRPNPRAVKRFVNMLLLQDLLARNRGVDPYDVMVLAGVLLVRSTMPDFYSQLEGDSTLLLRVAEDIQTAEDGAVPDWDERVVRLVKVLAGSAQGVPPDVAAYIDLAAAVRPQESAAEEGMAVTPSMLRELLTQQKPGVPLALRGAKFARGEDFSRMQLAGADLSMAQLAEARLQGTDLSGAYLTGADLRRADLTGANLSGAILTGADLSGAVLTGTDLRRAGLQGVVLSSVDLRDALVDDTFVRPGGAARPSTQEPPPVSEAELQAARATLVKRVGERLSQLAAPGELVDVNLRVRDDLSELTGAYRPLMNVDIEPATLRSSQLLEFFEKATQAPVPVVLQLASWSSSGPLRDWLAEELSGRYGMPLMAAKMLIDRGAIISVLDGLDELSSERQRQFIETTRAFIALSRKEHGSALMVVTTRPVGGLDFAIRLRLRGVVDLQPLDRAAASAYLQRHAGSKEQSNRLFQFVSNNPAFDLSSPLMLQILRRTFELRGTLPSSVDELIDQFAHDQLEKLGEKSDFDPRVAQNWLSALAKQLWSRQQVTFSSDDRDIRSVLSTPTVDRGLRRSGVAAGRR